MCLSRQPSLALLASAWLCVAVFGSACLLGCASLCLALLGSEVLWQLMGAYEAFFFEIKAWPVLEVQIEVWRQSFGIR